MKIRSPVERDGKVKKTKKKKNYENENRRSRQTGKRGKKKTAFGDNSEKENAMSNNECL